MLRFILFCFFCSINSYSCFAQQLHHLSTSQLIERQLIDNRHVEKFASIQVQDFQGRIKPVHTLSLELLRKIYGKSYFSYISENGEKKKLTATQVFLGMQFKPDSWQLLPCVKIKRELISSLNDIIKINPEGYTSVSQFFDFYGEYKLQDRVAKAYEKSPKNRDAFDKDIIKTDERVNILLGIFSGQFLKIFPKQNDPTNTWYASSGLNNNLSEEEELFYNKIIPTYLVQLEKAIKSNNWDKADDTVELIKEFQTIHGSDVLVSGDKVAMEIWFNDQQLFLYCLISYSIFGLLLLAFGFVYVLITGVKSVKRVIQALTLLLIITFVVHGFGIILRWYISGHAPWSNGYEATVFISWVSVLAGVIFSKQNIFALSVSSILALCLLGISHGSLMNPEITNLVPVLKSYWLLIHVAVITASYGFLGLGSLLSLICLLFYSLRMFTRKSIRAFIDTPEELTAISQLANTIGLYMLTIGTFLGGIWANESWGRYWGWDPKETWALISIIIYSFVLHIRIMIPKDYSYFYNVCSLFALGSIIMTFFGVNYYLSGLHSYAKGDSFPIPNWVYVAIVISSIIALLPLLLRLINRTKPNYNNLIEIHESI